MKKLFLLISIAIFSYNSTSAQCSELKKEVKEFTQETYYSTPAVLNGSGYMIAAKTEKADSTATTAVMFGVRISTPVYGATGVYVKFDDGTIYKDEIASVDCKYSSGGYWLTGIMLINEENKDYFYNRKVVKYALQNNENEVKPKSADKLQQNFRCVSDAE